MSIQPKYETYHYTTEICVAESQSIVECRIPMQELGKIVSVVPKVVPTTSTCADGEIRYGGKLTLCILYVNDEKKICRTERGVEFSHYALHRDVTQNCTCTTELFGDKISYRKEASSVYFTTIVRGKFVVYGEKTAEYLVGGETLALKKEKGTVVRILPIFGTVQKEDEFDPEYVTDILDHTEEVCVNYVTAEEGAVSVGGEVVVNICAVKDDTVVSLERTVPFKAELPVDESQSGVLCDAVAKVVNANLSLKTDEAREKSKLKVELDIGVQGKLYFTDYPEFCTDAFSVEREIGIKKQETKTRKIADVLRFTEHVGGKTTVSPAIETGETLLCSTHAKAELYVKKTGSGYEAEGVVSFELLVVDKDGEKSKKDCCLPVVFPVGYQGEGEIIACAVVCGLAVRKRKEGEVEAEATLKVTVTATEEVVSEYVYSLEEGEKYEEEKSAISVYFTGVGDDLFTTAKKLKTYPEDVENGNGQVVFPTTGNERIVVYRQRK